MYEQPYNPYAKNLAAVKEFFKTPCTLILGIAQAVSAVLSLIGILLISSKANEIIVYFRDYVLYLLDQAKASDSAKREVIQFFGKIDVSTASTAIFSSAPSILISILFVAAFFIIFFKSRNADPNATPMAGFTILYVFAVISLVGLILAAVGVFVLVGLLFWAYAAASSGKSTLNLHDIPFYTELTKQYPEIEKSSSTIILAIAIALAVVAVIAFFFILFTAVNRVRYYKSVRSSLSSVELQSKGAKPYGVMCVLSAVGTASSILSSASMIVSPHLKGRSNPMIGFAVVSMLSLIASLVALVMEAKLAFGYKKHIENVKYGYNTQAAPAAPYSPFLASGGYFNQQNQQNQPQVNPYMPPAPPAEPAAKSDFGFGPESGTNNAYSDPYGADSSDTAEINSLVDRIAAENEQAAAPAQDDYDGSGQTTVLAPDMLEPADEAAPAAAATCPLCGAEVDPAAPFCGNCGNRL